MLRAAERRSSARALAAAARALGALCATCSIALAGSLRGAPVPAGAAAAGGRSGAPEAVGPIGPIAATGAIGATGSTGSSGAGERFEEMRRAAEAGAFAQALEIARSEADPREAVRDEVWLRFRARDFDTAHALAWAALDVSPDDPWLAERALAAALWVRDPRRCERALARLDAILARTTPAAAEPFRAARDAEARDTAALLRTEAGARAAATRARAVAGLGIGATLLAILVLALRRER